MDCLFCKIIVGQIPNYTVYQNDYVLAFLDIHPCAKGHTVVISKKHFNNLHEMDGESWSKLMTGLQMAMKKIQSVLSPDGMNIAINNGISAGQAVPHVHWHILPRWEGDGGGSAHSIIKSKDVTSINKIADLFK